MLQVKYMEHMANTSTYTVKHLANSHFIFNGLKKEKNFMDKQRIR